MRLTNYPPSLRCQQDPSHGASRHVTSGRSGGVPITAHLCVDHLDLWIAVLERADGHRLLIDRPINFSCRPYGLCAIH